MNTEDINRINPLLSDEEDELVEFAEKLAAIQFNEIPAPTKRFSYIKTLDKETEPSRTFRLFKISAWPFALLVLIVASAHTYKQSQDSLPGSNFYYPIKQIGEQAKVYIHSGNPEKLAETQLALTLVRVEEAKQILASPSASEENKKVAIQAVETQAKKATGAIKQSSQFKPTQDAGQEVIKNLASLDKELAKLNTTDSASKTPSAAHELISVVAAAVEDQTQILSATNEKVELTGKITKISEKNLTVENTTFTYDKTALIIQEVINKQNISTTFDKVVAGKRITISGSKLDDGTLKAESILLLPIIKPKVELETQATPQANTNEIKAVLIIENP